MRRRRTFSISIDATIDLADISDDDLLEELRARELLLLEELRARELLSSEIADDLEQVHRAVNGGRTTDALALLERLMWPKFKTTGECLAAKKAQSDFLFTDARQ